MTAVIIDYGSGNLRSVAKALEWVADGACAVKVSSSPADILTATHVVLPGVGAFGDCKAGLDNVPGLKEALEEAVRQQGKPFLGICVGMQLLADKGFEHGEHAGLGWIGGNVVPLASTDASLKIPHMGWNDLTIMQPHPVLEGISTGEHAYFVHSYHYQVQEKGAVLATVDYGQPIAAVIGKDNIIATQFHPEKSQEMGLKLLKNFLAWKV
jgi:glutamine amidotransferase